MNHTSLSIDVFTGYYQISAEESSRKFTEFRQTQESRISKVKWPENDPSVFQNAINDQPSTHRQSLDGYIYIISTVKKFPGSRYDV